MVGLAFLTDAAASMQLLIYELMDEDLNSYINNTTKRREVPSLFQRLKIASQISSGLSWVASKGIIHGCGWAEGVCVGGGGGLSLVSSWFLLCTLDRVLCTVYCVLCTVDC
jgi:hypothetical protein